MLKIAGVQLHPGVRILIGAVFVGIGLMRHNGTAMMIIGGLLVVWGIAAVLDVGAVRARDGRQDERRRR